MKNSQRNYLSIDQHRLFENKIIIDYKPFTKIENSRCQCSLLDPENISKKLQQILSVLQQQIKNKNQQIQTFKKMKQQEKAQDQRTIEQLKMVNISLTLYNQSLLQQILKLKKSSLLTGIQGSSSKQQNPKQRSPLKNLSKKNHTSPIRRIGYIRNKNIKKQAEIQYDKPNSSQLMTTDTQAKIIFDQYVLSHRQVGKISKNGSFTEQRHNDQSKSQSSTNINSIPIPCSTNSLKRIKVNQSQKYLQTSKKPSTYKNSHLDGIFYKPYILYQKREKKSHQKIMPYPLIKKQTSNYQNETKRQKKYQHNFINIRDCFRSTFVKKLF